MLKPTKRRVPFVSLMLTVLLSSPAWGVSLEEFGQRVPYFYLHASKESFNTLQTQADQFADQLNATSNSASLLMTVMIASIAKKYDWPITSTAYGEQARQLLDGSSKLALFVNDDTVVTPAKLDVWWALFFSTGDTQYLDKLFRYVGNGGPFNSSTDMIVVKAASWSFNSNCLNHAAIARYARSQSASATDGQRQVLEKCLKPFGWITREGQPVENTDNMKSVDGFGAWVIVTADQQWERKWNTPSHQTPNFSQAKTVTYGEPLTILTFYSNPWVNEANELKILCDIKITRGDGSVSLAQNNIDCASGTFMGSPRNLRLTTAVIQFVGEANDPPGAWTVDVVVRDAVRKVSVPLKTGFTLK